MELTRRHALAGAAGNRRGAVIAGHFRSGGRAGGGQAGAEFLSLQGRRHPGHRGVRRPECLQARGQLHRQCEEGRGQRRAREGVPAARHVHDLLRAAGAQHRRQARGDRHRQRRAGKGQQQGRQRTVRRQHGRCRLRSEGGRHGGDFALPHRSRERPADRRRHAGVSERRSAGAGDRVEILDGRRRDEPCAGGPHAGPVQEQPQHLRGRPQEEGHAL